MKILFICHDLPSPFNPATLRVFHSLNLLSKKYKHEITIIAFKELTEEKKYIFKLNDYCELITVSRHNPRTISLSKKMAYITMNTLSPHNIFSKNPSFLNYSYSSKMHRKIKETLRLNKFDVIYDRIARNTG